MGKKHSKIIAIVLCCLLIFQQSGFAQVAAVELNIASRFPTLTNPLSLEKFRPLHLRSLSYDGLNNNFKLILDRGDTRNPKTQEIESAAKDLLKYFLIGISLPNDSFWVNLRPDSPNNIIDPLLAQTEVGKILLEADLQLKKDTAGATNPGTPEGREYWDKLYRKAAEIYGTQNVTIPTLVRPWIVPDEIIIRESPDSAYVYKATLKVMLEQDYLKGNATYAFKDEREKQLNEYSSQIMKEEIIPKLTKEINNAKRYAPLRQVYYSLILAQWFKARNQNKNTQYAAGIDKKDLSGLQSRVPYAIGTYFNAYKENFAKGEYSVKEPVSTLHGQVIRNYFSGGIVMAPNNTPLAQALALPMGSSANGSVIPGRQLEVGRDNLSVVVDGQTVQVMSAEPEKISRSGQQTTIPDLNTFPVRAQEKVRSTVDEYERKMQTAQANINALLVPLEADPRLARDKIGYVINQANRELGPLYILFEPTHNSFNGLYLSNAWVNSELVRYRLEVIALRQAVQKRLQAIIAKNNLAQESSGIVGETLGDWVRSFSTSSPTESQKLSSDELAKVSKASGEFGSGIDILTHATPVENLSQLLTDAQLLSVTEYERLHGSLPGRAQGKEGSSDVENKQVVFDENVVNAKYSRSFNLELPYVALAFSARSLITQNQFTVDDGIHIFLQGNVLESSAGLAIDLVKEPFVLVTNKKFEAVVMAQLRILSAKPNKLGLTNDNLESWVQSHLYLINEADTSYIRLTSDLQSTLYKQFEAQDAAGRVRPATGTFVPTGETGHGVNNKLLNLYTFSGPKATQQLAEAFSAENQDVRQDLKNQAEQALGRPVSEEELDAIQRAHEVGSGHFLGKKNADGTYEKNEDPNLAYTPEEIAQKARILKNAGFTNEQIRKLMKFGVTGNKDPGKQRDQAQAQKSGLEYAENILSDLNKTTFTSVTAELTNALNQLSIGDLLHIFVRLLKNEYNLNKSKSVFYLGSSQWDQIIFLIKGKIGVDIEALPYIISLFKNPDISVNEQIHLWEILMNLSQISAEEVIGALNAAGFAPESLAEMAMASGEVNKKSNAAVRSILQALLSQDSIPLETKRYYAKLILMIAERNLRRNRVFDVALVEKALDVLEPVTAFEQSQANQTTYADVKARYVAQVLVINEIFQQAMKIIYENPDISYAELCDKLLVKGPAGERFLSLTRNQRVAIRFALIRNRVDRLVLKQKFEEARGKYPIDAFNNASQVLMDLYQQRKVYARARDYAAIREINRRINSLRQRLAGLRRSVAPYLETECAIAVKDAPEVAIISLGPLGLEIHVDSHSLQKAIYSKLESKDGSKDNDPVLEMMRQVFGRANSRVDINSLRDALRRFPFYLYQDFQNEMVAYMTNAELRSRNFNNLLDEYFQLYLHRIFEYIKNQEWFKKVGMTEGELKSYLEARMLSPEWQQVKARLRTAKQMLDNLIDLKATLIYHEMLAQGAVNSQELKDRAYKEASIYVMGIFQLVPILKLDRITAILDLFMAELEAKGISRSNILRIFTSASNEADRRDIEKQQLWSGMARGGVVWTIFRGGDRVIDHERQHVIFGQYTGAVAMKYTPGNEDFHRLLSDAVRGKAEFTNEQPLADLTYIKISLSDQTSGSSTGIDKAGLQEPGGNQDVRQDLKNQAEQALGRPVSEEELDAIQRAHEVGSGHFLGKKNADGTYEKNEDPNLAYTPEEIAQKARILKNAGFTNEQIRKLMKFGVAGKRAVDINALKNNIHEASLLLGTNLQTANTKKVGEMLDNAEKLLFSAVGYENVLLVDDRSALERARYRLERHREANNFELKVQRMARQSGRPYFEMGDSLFPGGDSAFFYNPHITGHATNYEALYSIIFNSAGILIPNGFMPSYFNKGQEGQFGRVRISMKPGVVSLVFDLDTLLSNGIRFGADAEFATNDPVPLRYLVRESKIHVWYTIQNILEARGIPFEGETKQKVIRALGYNSEAELRMALGLSEEDLKVRRENITLQSERGASSATSPSIPEGAFNALDLPGVAQSIQSLVNDIGRKEESSKNAEKIDKYRKQLSAFGRTAALVGPGAYYPFGGFDPHTPFMLIDEATDVFSMGDTSFGSIADIEKFNRSGSAYDKAGSFGAGFDSIREMRGIMGDYGLSGLGALAIARIISLLSGKIERISYFEIQEDGSLRFLRQNEIQDQNRLYSAVIEFTVQDPISGKNVRKRYWYIQHDIYDGTFQSSYLNKLGIIDAEKYMSRLTKSGYIDQRGVVQPKITDGFDRFNLGILFPVPVELKKKIFDILYSSHQNNLHYASFIGRLQFQSMLIKAANHMWDEVIEDNKEDASLGYLDLLIKKTLVPARDNAAIVISDNRAEGANRKRGYAPHSIWRQRPNTIMINKDESFGYSNEGDYLYFGPASWLIDSPLSKPVFSLLDGTIAPIDGSGGIDFRFLPIVTQSMDNLKASMRNIPMNSLQRTNLTQEWSDIGRLINSGITLSAERLKEYFAASCFKDNLNNDAGKIASCIAGILRAQEESCSLTDPALKDILIVLSSGRSQEELKLAFAN